MSCDITCYAERHTPDGWEAVAGFEPFVNCSYGVFGFLAGVRDLSNIKPICGQRGFPPDASPEATISYEHMAGVSHSASWVEVSTLVDFDYDAEVQDRRNEEGATGSFAWEDEATEVPSYREFLGEVYFKDLLQLKSAKADRVVFWFDN